MESSSLRALVKLLPEYDEIRRITRHYPEADYILKLACENMREIADKSCAVGTEEQRFLVECLVDRSWERIHTGHFSEVPVETRQIYAIANYFKIFYLLLESMALAQVARCSEILDEALLLGCCEGVFAHSTQLQKRLVEWFDQLLGTSLDIALPIIEPQVRQAVRCDIQTLDCPSVEMFVKSCLEPQTPALLLNTIAHWPARQKWPDLNYLLKVAGNRTVPIEIGSNYAADEWSQQLVKVRDFLKRQFAVGDTISSPAVEYLAQHELFQQIPALRQDIRIPDYCMLGRGDTSAITAEASVDIKAWLGPKGTISPMHYDPKDNLLCQVFGAKKIILAAPADTPNLYPHESEFLSNTSQIDAAQLDFVQFPSLAAVRFYHLLLQEGDCLYIPPKWWHYVQSETPSFSVSFWWE